MKRGRGRWIPACAGMTEIMKKEPYKLDVKNLIVKGSVGSKEIFSVKATPDIEIDEENVLKAYEGEVKATLLEDSILAEFNINYEMETVCARCLKTFLRKGAISFDREYLIGKRAVAPRTGRYMAGADGLIVDKEFCIEVAGPILEEIAFDIPMKPLCKESCKGIT